MDAGERAREQQLKLGRERRANDAYARHIENREAVQFHKKKALEYAGTHEGAVHAAEAGQIMERIMDRFDTSEFHIDPAKRVAGGELVPLEQFGEIKEAFSPALPMNVGEMLGDDDLLRRVASRDRIDALVNAESLALGVETAESIKAENTIEQMLAHEMAVAHMLGLKFASRASVMLSGVAEWSSEERQQVQSIEAARLMNTSTKCMKAVTEAAEALHKLRGGKPQRIVVTHVHQAVQVNEGGQAVVNGALQQGTALPGRGPGSNGQCRA